MTTKQCYESTELQKLLGEELGSAEESKAVLHIGSCDKCRSSLLGLSASPTTIDNLKQFLPHALSFGLSSANRHPSLKAIKRILAPTDDPTMIGRLGSHEISGVIGQGSTGIVFKALDTRLDRVVAIKILAPIFQYDDSARLRFEREARAIATVVHENVVPIHSVDEFDGLPYFVMPYFPAGSLQERINQKGALSTCEVVRFGLQIAKGLSEAHKQGIIHRDIKPANVLLERGIDRAYVSDFGLAQISDDALLTQTGVLAGTPEYMSPEQVQGKTLDCRSDLFSLGSVMYASSTGQSPFRSDTVYGVMKKVTDSTPASICEINAGVPGWLDVFVAKLLSPNPDERFEFASEVATYLEAELAYLNAPTDSNQPQREWHPGRESIVSPRKLFVAIALFFVTALAIAFIWWQTSANFQTVNQSPNGQVQGNKEEPGNSPDQMLRHKIETQKEVTRLIDEGNAQFDQKNLSRSAECFRSALGLDAENELAHAGLATTNQRMDLYLASYKKACSHAIQNETDDAIRWLEKAIEGGFRDLNCLEVDRDLDNLRNDDRFEKLIRSIRLQSRKVNRDKP